MEDLLIAYYLGVIMIGFATLAIAGFWAVKSHDRNLWNFCALYASFTLVLIISVLKKYLSLNVEGYTPQAWYWVSGISLIVECLVIVLFIHFLVGAYQIPSRKFVSSIFFITMFICIGLIVSPIGSRLDAANKVIQLGIGMKISSGWYIVSFTVAILIGFGLLRRVLDNPQRNLVLGSLLFAAVGYIESLLNFPESLRTNTAIFREDSAFLYSSIPYTLYGLFLIYHFLHFWLPTPIGLDQVSESFISTYGITKREHEIIIRVIQGKSNTDIANELVISLATVKTHLHNIYQKVDVDSRFDLLARVRSSQ